MLRGHLSVLALMVRFMASSKGRGAYNRLEIMLDGCMAKHILYIMLKMRHGISLFGTFGDDKDVKSQHVENYLSLYLYVWWI